MLSYTELDEDTEVQEKDPPNFCDLCCECCGTFYLIWQAFY